MNQLLDITKMFHAISVLRTHFGCQTKFEKLAGMLQAGATKLRESSGTGRPSSLTKANARDMLSY